MDEATQQAIQVGVNITIFIIALSASLLLLMGVKDVAEVASEYNAALPTGSRVVSVGVESKRTISGFEIISYYSNYTTALNAGKPTQYVITKIQDDASFVIDVDLENENQEETSNIIGLLNGKGIDLSKEYEVIIEKYDKDNDLIYVMFKSID